MNIGSLFSVVSLCVACVTPRAHAQNSYTFPLELVQGQPTLIQCQNIEEGFTISENETVMQYRVPVSPFALNTKGIVLNCGYQGICTEWGAENLSQTPYGWWSEKFTVAFQFSVRGTRRLPARAAISLSNVGFSYNFGAYGLAPNDGLLDFGGLSGRWGQGVACNLTTLALTTDEYACRRVAYEHPTDPAHVRIDLLCAYTRSDWFGDSLTNPAPPYDTQGLGNSHAWNAAGAMTMTRPVGSITFLNAAGLQQYLIAMGH